MGFQNKNKLFEYKTKEIESSKLIDKFIIPPFSIFDAKQDYWKRRKGMWIKLGIKSELGRNNNLTYNMGYSWDKNINYKNLKIEETTSIFDPVLCEIIYRWFSNKDDVIIDPFAGGSVRGVVASYLDRNYIGIDLRQEQIDANNFNFKEINEQNPIKYKPKWICGDSIKIKELTNNIEADLIFSCPPYYNLEVYSELEGDISNLSSYEDFKKQYFAIIKNTCNQLKNNRFACFVVGEIRDKKGFYRNFVGDTIEAFKQGGLNYYNEAILLTNIGSLSLRAPKQFNSSRKLGKGHQNVLIFYKGDCSKIKERYKEIIID